MSRRLGARRLAVVLLLAVVVLAAGALVVSRVMANQMRSAARSHAVDDAELVASLGFAAAAADGNLTSEDLRAARHELAVVRPLIGLSEVVVWDRDGHPVFSDPQRPHAGPPALIGQAMSRSATVSAVTAAGPSDPARFRVAVPLGGPPPTYTAEFDFASVPVEGAIGEVNRVVTGLIVAGAALLYVGMIPALAWAVRHLPTHAERRRDAAARDVDRAIDRGEMELWFQPKVSAADDDVIGVEALLRQRHPIDGVLAPHDIIAVAETCDALLDRLTRTILFSASDTASRWLDAGIRLPVAVNIAPSALVRSRVVDDVRTALDRAALEPRLLTLEITESALLAGGHETTRTLAELRELGVAISMDDFGTGHSSLRRIADMPLDELKIDRSFVQAMGTDERVQRIIKLIVDLARDLGVATTAEGVETQAQRRQLTALGCDNLQGYLIARPMPERELLAWLEQHRSGARRDTVQ